MKMVFTVEELKRNALATLETALLMKQGPERFGTTLDEMLRSFWIFALTIPFTLYAISLIHPTRNEIADLSYGFVASLFLVKMLIVAVLSILLSYGFARHYERMAYFCSCITAMNWTGLIGTVLFLPSIIMVTMGIYTWDQVYPYLIFLTMYSYVCTGFVFTYTMRIPWEMGGFLAVCILAINQTSIDLLYWIAGQL